MERHSSSPISTWQHLGPAYLSNGKTHNIPFTSLRALINKASTLQNLLGQELREVKTQPQRRKRRKPRGLLGLRQDMAAEPDKFLMIDFEETELRLGLPGGKGKNNGKSTYGNGKRGFPETVDLKLNLSSKDSNADEVEKMKEKTVVPLLNSSTDPAKPPAKDNERSTMPGRRGDESSLADT